MFKYYSCVKMTFWKVLHFLADMSKHICELMTFHTKGTTCSPKKLSSHTHGSFCQEPEVSNIPSAFCNFTGSCAWHIWGCFWEAGTYPTHVHYDPNKQIPWAVESDLGTKLNGYPRNFCGCLYRAAVLKCISHFIMILQGMWKSKMLRYGKYFQGSQCLN